MEKNNDRLFFGILLFALLHHAVKVGAQHWQYIPTNTTSSFRGVSVADNNVAWVSGTKGFTGISVNGGISWTFRQVKGYEQCDFRSIYAFDGKRAVIANAGTPAYILTTADGGLSWKQVYQNKDTAAFFDGIDFWNNRSGIIYGDPIAGKMLLLHTEDSGNTWLPTQGPALAKGEASFAASGTAIRCMGKSKAVIATGGTISRLLISSNKGQSWQLIATPMLHGQSSTGTFSVACAGRSMIIAGGDYLRDSLRKDHVFLSKDGGESWVAPAMPTRGYRECVEFINNTLAIATGPGGTDITYDAGIHWQPLNNEKQYHTIRKSRRGNLVIIAGDNGKLALLKWAATKQPVIYPHTRH